MGLGSWLKKTWKATAHEATVIAEAVAPYVPAPGAVLNAAKNAGEFAIEVGAGAVNLGVQGIKGGANLAEEFGSGVKGLIDHGIDASSGVITHGIDDAKDVAGSAENLFKLPMILGAGLIGAFILSRN